MDRIPTILIAGNFAPGTTGAGLSSGFRGLGWAVQEVGGRSNRIKTTKRLVSRVLNRVDFGRLRREYHQEILDDCAVIQPDVFLTVKGVGLTRDVLSRIRAIGAKTVMYYPDLNFSHFGVAEDTFSEYDLFITTKSFQVEFLQKNLDLQSVAFIPHGYVPAVHRPILLDRGSYEHNCDVLYAGSHSPYKRKWLEGLVKLAPQIDTHVIGNNWGGGQFALDLARGFQRHSIRRSYPACED